MNNQRYSRSQCRNIFKIKISLRKKQLIFKTKGNILKENLFFKFSYISDEIH